MGKIFPIVYLADMAKRPGLLAANTPAWPICLSLRTGSATRASLVNG